MGLVQGPVRTVGIASAGAPLSYDANAFPLAPWCGPARPGVVQAECAPCRTLVDGHANVIVVRGKPRWGVEYEKGITITWEGGGGAVKGSLHVSEVSRQTLEEDELEVTASVDEKKKGSPTAEELSAAAAARGLSAAVRKALQQLKADLIARTGSV